MSDFIPTRYQLALDELTDVRAVFRTDHDTYPSGDLVVQWAWGREDWNYAGRPSVLHVTVTVP